MITDLKPYPAYKPSSVAWLGDVPAHWEVRRLKNWLEMNQATLPENTNPDYTFAYVDIGTVETGRLIAKPERIRFGASPSRARRIVRSGDTIVSTVRTYLKAVWHAEDTNADLIASTGFAVLTPKPETSPKFVSYVCQSDPFTNRVTAESVGIAYPAIAETRLGTFGACIPPLPEQTVIVRFLDHADRRIRRYIRAKQKLIALLEEQKQAIIHQAVTGQVDVRTGQPYPAYKPSGVEWLRDVPAHWEKVRNGQLFAQRDETGFPELPILEVSLKTGVRIRDLENSDRKQMMNVRSDYKRAIAGDIAYNMMRMWQGAVGVAPVDGLVSPAYVIARPLHGAESRYFSALFRTRAYMAEVDKYSRGIVKDRNRLYWEDFKQMPSLCPPAYEQTAIVAYLDKATADIDTAIACAHRQIELLHEYRTRLIADVVTGKLDVREAAAALPEVDPLAAEDDVDETFAADESEFDNEAEPAEAAD